jgi:hypothetical protein
MPKPIAATILSRNIIPDEEMARDEISTMPRVGPALATDLGTRLEADDTLTPQCRGKLANAERAQRLANNDGAFDGSFAGTARQSIEVYVKPWYLRGQYFSEGWADPSIWRAAVSVHHCILESRC